MFTPQNKVSKVRRSVLKTVLLSHLLTVSLAPYAQADNNVSTLFEHQVYEDHDKLGMQRMHTKGLDVDLSHLSGKKDAFSSVKRQKYPKDEINEILDSILADLSVHSVGQPTVAAKNIENTEAEVEKPFADQTPSMTPLTLPSAVDSALKDEAELAAKKQTDDGLLDLVEDFSALRISDAPIVATDGEEDDSRNPKNSVPSPALDIVMDEDTAKVKFLTRAEMIDVVKSDPKLFLKTLIDNKASFEDFQAVLLEIAPNAHKKLYDAKMIDTRIYDQSLSASIIFGVAGVLTDVFAMEWFKQSLYNKTLVEGMVPLMHKTGNWVGEKVADTLIGKVLSMSENFLSQMVKKGLSVIVGDAVQVELFKWAPQLAQTIVDQAIMRVSKAVKLGAKEAVSFFSKDEKLVDKDLDQPTPEIKKVSVLEAFWDTVAMSSEMTSDEVEQVLSLMNPTAFWILEEENLSQHKANSEFWKSDAWKAMKLGGTFVRDVGLSFALSPVFAIVAKRFVANYLISNVCQPLSDYIAKNYYVDWALAEKAAGNMAAVRAELDVLKMGIDPAYIPTSGLRELPGISTIIDSVDYAKDGIKGILGYIFSENFLKHIPIVGAPDSIAELDMVAKLYWDQTLIGVADGVAQAAYHPTMEAVGVVVEKAKEKLSEPKQKRVRKQRKFFDPSAASKKEPSTYDHYDPKTGALTND
ncbi:MAG: hypothetical protein ACTHJ4_00555 [Candidatus Nucleicultricaceae bacterium]